MTVRAVRNILIGSALLLLLCIIAGRPQVFSDTRAYHALGQETLGLVWPGAAQADALAPPAPQSAGPQAVPSQPAPSPSAAQRSATQLAYTVAASRSPYWSAIFYMAVQAGSAWLFVVLQALLAASLLWVSARALGVGQAYLPIVAVLAFASSLPVQVMFLTPDLFAGLTILAAMTLACGRARLTRGEAIAMWLVMVAGALFHTSHLLLLAGLGGGTVIAGAALRHSRDLLRPGAAMLVAAVVGGIGALAFPVAVQIVRHQPVYAPPFVAARLIADGPGRWLLREDCRTGAEWGWCPYRDQRLDDVNTILWDTDPADASFQAADYSERVRIIREQTRFAWAVVRRYPAAVASATVSNVTHLFVQYGVGEALGDPTARYRDPKFAVFGRIVPGTQACVTGAASCAPRVDLTLLNAVIGLTLIAAWIGIVLGIAVADGRRAWGRAVLYLIAGLSLNAIVCGGISGNAERYQSRVTWLVPMLAIAIVADLLAQRRTGSPAGAPGGRTGAAPPAPIFRRSVRPRE